MCRFLFFSFPFSPFPSHTLSNRVHLTFVILQEQIEQLAVWHEDIGDWELPGLAYSGNVLASSTYAEQVWYVLSSRRTCSFRFITAAIFHITYLFLLSSCVRALSSLCSKTFIPSWNAWSSARPMLFFYPWIDSHTTVHCSSNPIHPPLVPMLLPLCQWSILTNSSLFMRVWLMGIVLSPQWPAQRRMLNDRDI